MYRASFCLLFIAGGAFGQQVDPATTKPPEPQDKHIFWLIPNFRTSPYPVEYKPLTVKEKFKIAAQDSFDQGTVALAAAFAGEAQLNNSDRTFGQGVQGYAKYFGASYGDFVIGNYMTEGVFPTILHQDPRYFRRGTGSKMSRAGYAAGQIFWTHHDSGRGQFNYSELVGNAAAVAISQAYYPGNRDAGDALTNWGTQVGIDMISNMLKEFWPDINHHFSHKHADQP